MVRNSASSRAERRDRILSFMPLPRSSLCPIRISGATVPPGANRPMGPFPVKLTAIRKRGIVRCRGQALYACANALGHCDAPPPKPRDVPGHLLLTE